MSDVRNVVSEMRAWSDADDGREIVITIRRKTTARFNIQVKTNEPTESGVRLVTMTATDDSLEGAWDHIGIRLARRAHL